ncbi:MAG: MerC domain-containing protein [Thermodesulfobacteriota bacterium]
MKIEFVYDSDCPNAERSRENIRLALRQIGIKTSWDEWERNDPDLPERLMDYGSPTILIDGVDIIAGLSESHGDSCRLYKDSKGIMGGVPSVEAIIKALADSRKTQDLRSDRTGFIAGLGAVGAVFLPKFICPACWPVYAGILSTMGLGFLLHGVSLLILSVTLLGLALLVFALRGRKRGSFLPFWIGLVGVSLVLTGKFFWINNFSAYAGAAFLMLAVIVDVRPLRRVQSCQVCNEKNGRR